VNRDSTVDMQSEKKKVDEEAVTPTSINIERKDLGVIYPPDDEVSPQHAIWLANDNNATVDKSNNEVDPRQEVEKENEKIVPADYEEAKEADDAMSDEKADWGDDDILESEDGASIMGGAIGGDQAPISARP